MRGGIIGAVAVALLAQTAAPPPATPIDAASAILEAFKTHSLVALGDAHGNMPGEAFQLALVRDPRFPTVVNDVVIEFGNSRHQGVIDRYVNSEDVPIDLQRLPWLDTTQQHVASLDIPQVVQAIRAVNAALPPARRLRVLLAEPPIPWDSLRTGEDVRKWNQGPLANRDAFAVDLLRREVLSKNRRALLLFGAGHFFRKVINQSMVTILEEGNKFKVFTIWTNAAADMSAIQPDVATWPVPSLTLLRNTVLGRADLSLFFGPGGNEVPQQWRAPMQDQFDAVLYVGPVSAATLARPKPWKCSEPAMAERLRRLGLERPALAERVRKECLPD
jgi:hypothetical protein